MLSLFLVLHLLSYVHPSLAVSLNVTSSHTLNSTDGIYAPGWVQAPEGRGTFEILYQSAATLFLCAWSSLHMNIAPQGDTNREAIDRMVGSALAGFFLPELIIFAAAEQWWQERRFRGKLNEILRQKVGNGVSTFYW
jgi:hypothetical protein